MRKQQVKPFKNKARTYIFNVKKYMSARPKYQKFLLAEYRIRLRIDRIISLIIESKIDNYQETINRIQKQLRTKQAISP